MSGNHDENKPLTRAEMKRGHLATQHRILNVLIVLASIAAVYLVIKPYFKRAAFMAALFILSQHLATTS